MRHPMFVAVIPITGSLYKVSWPAYGPEGSRYTIERSRAETGELLMPDELYTADQVIELLRQLLARDVPVMGWTTEESQ